VKPDPIAHRDHDFGFVPIARIFRAACGEKDERKKCGALHPMYFTSLAEYAGE
jgi:hypothetical protein